MRDIGQGPGGRFSDTCDGPVISEPGFLLLSDLQGSKRESLRLALQYQAGQQAIQRGVYCWQRESCHMLDFSQGGNKKLGRAALLCPIMWSTPIGAGPLLARPAGLADQWISHFSAANSVF
jgi:hypothetical protein